MLRLLLAAVAAALVGPGAAAGATALVDVSVATLWKAPNLARPIDAPSLGNPVDPRRWSVNLASTADRVWLDSHVQTQALYGQRVVLEERRGAWYKVAVVDEPDPRDAGGYPGWLPASQLVGDNPDTETAKRFAIVTAQTAWLTTRSGKRLLQLSFATKLSLLRLAGDHVVVETPRRTQALLPRSAVRIVGASPRRPTGGQILATARRFLGVRYLWGGLSAWGFDCSGIVWAAYRSYGVTIPRDADPQFRGPGKPVAPSALRPGDLVFYGSQSYVHHVAIYAGGGRMLEAPDSAHSVRVVPLRRREFAGARRY